jgi:hypothetical protein
MFVFIFLFGKILESIPRLRLRPGVVLETSAL